MTIVEYLNTIYSKNIAVISDGDDLISYEPFWKTLKDKGVLTYALINKHHISSATIDRMKKGNGISTVKINDFCNILGCRVEDVILFIPDEE